MRRIRWGILAPGRIANKFAQGLDAIPEAVKYAVGSRDIGRAEAFAARHGFEKAYGSYRELASDPLVDIIYIAAPHTLHEQATLLCLVNGKAALCEKPLAANARQAIKMAQCARRNGVFLMEAMWTRFLPAMRKTRELIDGGAIGEARFVSADFGFKADVIPDGRLFSPALGGGSLLDVGIYNLSLCSMVFGKQPERIHPHMVFGSSGVDVEASALLTYGGGQSALLYSALSLDTPHEARIVGSDGRIELPDYWHGTYLTLRAGDRIGSGSRGSYGGQTFVLPYESTGYQFEAQEAMRCVSEGLIESPTMPFDESVAILETADRIRECCGLRYPCDV